MPDPSNNLSPPAHPGGFRGAQAAPLGGKQPGREAKPGRSRFRWWHIPIVLFLLLLTIWGAWRVNLRMQINAELARIRAEGYPVTPAELDAWYPYPEGENAADHYAKAFAAMVEPTEAEMELLPIVGYAELPPPNEPIPPEMLAAMEAHLEKNAEAIRLLHEAGKLEECRWPGEVIDLNDLNGSGLDHLGDTYRASRLLSCFAVVSAFRNDAADATRAVEDMWRIAWSLRNDPDQISLLFRDSVMAEAQYISQHVLHRADFSDDHLLRQMLALEKTYDEVNPVRALAGIRVFVLAVFDDTNEAAFRIAPLGKIQDDGTVDRPLSGTRWSIRLVRFLGIWDLDKLAYLKLMREAIANVPDLDYEKAESVRIYPPFYCVMTDTFPPATAAALRTHVRITQRGSVLLAALAAERYRLKNGDWPAKLTDLVPDYLDQIPADLFNDSNPINMIRHEDRLVIYSFAEDGDDDLGNDPDEGDVEIVGDEDGDILFTLYRRPLP